MDKILISGGSGFLGTAIIKQLQSHRLETAVLGRKKLENIDSYIWDIKNNILDVAALNGVGTIIHLAGAPLADKRWTTSYKKEIIESRVESTRLLFNTIKKNPGKKIHTIISASGVGYYGNTGDVWQEEEFHAKDDFIGQVCTEWEKSVMQFETLGIRVVIMRIGIVLANSGGALLPLSLPVKYFAGAPLGSGRQFLSWIHIDDLSMMFEFAVVNKKLHGVYNAAAPGPVTNKIFVREIASVLKRPVWPFNVPSFFLKLILGERAAIVLDGQRVSSEKIRMTGFEFMHTDLNKTLKQLLK